MIDNRNTPLKLREVVVPSLAFFLLVDLYIVVVCIVSNSCDVALKSWLVVCLLLSFPTLTVSHFVKNYFGSSLAILFELFATFIGFVWMTIGSAELNMTTTCQTQSPLLWWTVFVIVTTFWCSVAGMVVSLTIATVVQQPDLVFIIFSNFYILMVRRHKRKRDPKFRWILDKLDIDLLREARRLNVSLRPGPEHNCFDLRYSSNDPKIKLLDDNLRVVGTKQWNTTLTRGCAYHGQWYFEAKILGPDLEWMSTPLHGWEGSYTTISELLEAVPSLKDYIFPTVRIGWGSRFMKLDAPLGYNPYSCCISQLNGDLIYSRQSHIGGENSRPLQVGDVIGCAINLCQPIFDLEDPRGNPDLWPYTKRGLLCDVSNESTLPPRIINKNSYASFSINGKWLSRIVTPVYCAEYHPAVSTYMGSSLSINLGPDFKYSPPSASYKPACLMKDSKYPCKEDLIKHWVFIDTKKISPGLRSKFNKLNIKGVVSVAEAEIGLNNI